MLDVGLLRPGLPPQGHRKSAFIADTQRQLSDSGAQLTVLTHRALEEVGCVVSDFPAQIKEAKEFSHHGLGMAGGMEHGRKTLDMGAEGLVPIVVCTTLSLDHQVAIAPMSPCIISDVGRQTPHNVGSRMGNSCEDPWQVSNPSSLDAEVACLGVSAVYGPRASGLWVSRSHDRKEDNAAILGDHDRDGTILGSGWVGGDRSVRSGCHIDEGQNGE